MKLLKLSVPSGYKMLEKGFEVNFLTKTRVKKETNNNDLIELEPGLYLPKETVFVGKNSSGKSTVLSLINYALHLVESGRVPLSAASNNGLLDLELTVYSNHSIFLYKGSFKKGDLTKNEYLIIQSEELYESEYKSSYKKDLSNVSYKPCARFVPSVDGDTSMLSKIIDTGRETNLYLSSFEKETTVFPLIENVLNTIYKDDIFIKLVKVFDDSIDLLKRHKDEQGNATDQFEFKRVTDTSTVLYNYESLESILSDGTIRGINLYGPILIAFINGGTIVVDELEKSFNRNLIGNLINMINDPTLNKAGASFIYSTHYAELLDETNRCDNINVLHRNKSTITIKNMCLDYDTRTDLLKSSQFDQNAFDNNVNYELLAELKRDLRNNHGV